MFVVSGFILYLIYNTLTMKILDDQNFKDETKSGVYLVDLHADWCGPCRALSPILDELDGTIDGVTFSKLDTDASPAITGQFGVMSIPTVLILKDGQEVKRIVGLNPKASYVDALNDVLKA
jgi:thioredoxin 1